MTHTDKVNTMFQLLVNAKYPMTREEIMVHIGDCHRSTFNRIKNDVFSQSNRMVLTNRSMKPIGYYLDNEDGREKSIPNILLRDKEIEALVVIEQMAESLAGGLLSDTVDDFRTAINRKIKSQKINLSDWENRIKIVPMAAKKLEVDVLRLSVTSVLWRKRLKISYRSLTNDGKPKERTVSPQTLLRYRGNWYMDAYCHSSEEIRTFLLSRIISLEPLSADSITVPNKELTERYVNSYGIFSGTAQNSAKIRFTGIAAKVIVQEEWHPDQIMEKQEDGSIILQIPYARADELIMDVLKWGSEAEVLESDELRAEISERIKKMQKLYHCRKN